ncbi:PREDICTED: MARCKS-related protein [Calidris pugnax]|uniref:MARCKS-related protein n=1 Tax=Calidris pugnax TaxID=198806 RepID=UPI00071E6421|nr:PREDICTED: MARCKS-related protein [Calidris pugnax]
MGSQGSKAAKAEASAPPAGHAAATEPGKANGQENGHLRFNGDMTPKAVGEGAPVNGNGSAEPLPEESKGEAGGGDAIEPAPPAEEGDAKPEGAAAPKDTPKKKKKFSFKKSFKLSGISFRKNKKEAGDSSGSSPTTEEQGKVEENPTCSATGGTEPSAPPEEGTAEEQGSPGESGDGQQQGAKEPKAAEAGEKEEEKQQPGGENPGDTAKPEEPSKPAEPEPTTAPVAAAEQKEE